MKINKIFNNNSLLASDNKGNEMVLIGCGIAFSKKVGEIVEEHKIEKIFLLKKDSILERFKLVLEDVSSEYVLVCYNIVKYFKETLDIELSDYIYITFTDHINTTINLFKKGINKPNVFTTDIQKFYPKEYDAGLIALNIIYEELGYELPKNEATNIAMHIINAQNGNNQSDIYLITKRVSDILNIIKYSYSIKIDEKSISYARLITHLRYFLKRMEDGEFIDEEDDFLLNQIRRKHKKAYECMLKIQKYLGIDLPYGEQLYLTLHIKLVTIKNN